VRGTRTRELGGSGKYFRLALRKNAQKGTTWTKDEKGGPEKGGEKVFRRERK